MGGLRLRVADAPPTLDYFFVGGQSNMTAAGGNSPYPTVPAGSGLEYAYASRSVILLADPMSGSETGKGGPSVPFAIEYKNVTGRQAIMHNRARNGTSQQIASQPAPDRSWDVTGASGAPYKAALTEIDAALVDLAASGLRWRFAGILWDQGGNDAIAIDDGMAGVSKQGYKDAFAAMAAGFRTRYGATLPIFVFRLGRPNAADTTGFQQIRDAQEEIDTADPYTYIVWRGGIDFPARGLMFDTYHYQEAGYVEEGTLGARAVAGLI